MKNLLIVTVFLLACAGPVQAQTRYHQYTEKFRSPPDAAEPLATGYIGGSGDEYLTGGAFLPDGSAVLAGTCLGPVFDPPGIDVMSSARAGKAPDSPVTAGENLKSGPSLSVPDWTYTAGAGFIVHLAPGFKTVKNAVCLQWGSGSLTDIACGAQGGIFVTGVCGPEFTRLARKVTTGLDGGSGQIYLGKIKPDLTGFEWSLIIEDDLWTAPKLSIIEGNVISLIATDAFHFDTSGKLLKATKLKMPGNWSRGVNPLTHAVAIGGDNNTSLGFGPWRKPTLHIYNDEGELTDEFYRWHEKLVGISQLFLVSDSDPRVLNYDDKGKLLIAGWSDGGNTVFNYTPYDLTEPVEKRTGSAGLGFSLWGAGVGSFSHIMKIDPETGEPLGKTIFCSYLAEKNKPNSVEVTSMNSSDDGSILMAGWSSWGLIETGNRVNTMSVESDYMGGPFVAVLTGKMDSIRFSSLMPGGGMAPIARNSKSSLAMWGMGSGICSGREMAIFVGGALQDPRFQTSNCPQTGFGGGKMDGQYLILGL